MRKFSEFSEFSECISLKFLCRCSSKAEVATKRSDLTKEKLVEVLRCYEQKVQSQHLDVERLQEAYARAKGELTAIRNMQQNPEVMVDSLKECQRYADSYKLCTEDNILFDFCSQGIRGA